MTLSRCLAGPAAERLPAGNERIVITGASGWIGTATLELLYNTLGADAFAERVLAFGSAARSLDFGAGKIQQRPLAALLALPAKPTLVLHLAFLTKDKVSGMDAGEYQRLNRALSRTVLEALDLVGATAVFVASSGAAEFADDAEAAADLRLYGQLKKADEDAFASWASEHGHRAVIARIFALSGPHINKHDTYALASFIKNALAGRAIDIRATSAVYRSYVSVREMMSLVFAALLEKEGVLRFSTGGERLEMQQVAQIVSDTLGPVTINRPPVEPKLSNDYVGDHAAYLDVLARYGLTHIQFAEQVAETAQSFAADPASKKHNCYA